MDATNTDIIGSITYKIALKKFCPILAEEEHNGGFLVLDNFTPEQLAGFIEAAKKDTQNFSSVKIKFPASVMQGITIEDEFLTNGTAVKVRNQPLDGFIVITCSNEDAVEESLGNKEKISHEDLREDKESVGFLVSTLAAPYGQKCDAQTKKEITALSTAVLQVDEFDLQRSIDYLRETIKLAVAGNTVAKAAGESLPHLQLPLHSNCFSQVTAEKVHQPSIWKKPLLNHEKNKHYLNKKKPSIESIDNDELTAQLKLRRTEDTQEERKVFLDALEDYIAADIRDKRTENFLFNFEWDEVRPFFGKERKTSARKFIELTKAALSDAGKEPTPTEQTLLEQLEKKSRKPGEATDEEHQFFEDYHDAFEQAPPKVLKDWENFVFGKKCTCDDLITGVFFCLQRLFGEASVTENVWVELRALRQSQKNDFVRVPVGVCEHFERHYAQLEKHTGGLVKFSKIKNHKTLLVRYTEDAVAKLDKKKSPNINARKNAKEFEFSVVLCAKDKGLPVDLKSVSLVWKFPKNSILHKELSDIKALIASRIRVKKSATVKCIAAYDTAGQKGLPLSITLDDNGGFSAAPGAKDKGSFVRSQDAIETVDEEFKDLLEKELAAENISEEIHSDLLAQWTSFDEVYTESIIDFRIDAMAFEKVPAMIGHYEKLLDQISQISSAKLRKGLTKLVLQIGAVSIKANNKRPDLALICPWNPVRLEALKGRMDHLVKNLAEVISGDARFSDGRTGALYFDDVNKIINASLYPEVAVFWNENAATGMTAVEAKGGYTLHTPFQNDEGTPANLQDLKKSVVTVIHEADEYLRLQPHEKDNLSVLLFQSQEPALPRMISDELNRKNASDIATKKAPMNCEILLSHKENKHLQDVYKSLVATSNNQHSQSQTEGFLSKVRINISAATDIMKRPRKTKTPPVDLVYCKDLLSSQARTSWLETSRKEQTSEPHNLVSHRWNRQIPHTDGANATFMLHCCPNQTNAGWQHIRAIAVVCNESGIDSAWATGKAIVPAKTLRHDDTDVQQFLINSHKLGVWVITEDEMLDRRILEDSDIKVIRYIQSVSRGRNLIISSTANDYLLVNTLEMRLKDMISGSDEEVIKRITKLFLKGAKEITGGLILKAARRTNNTSELMGMVLSKFLVEAIVGKDRPVCWCSLDDYSSWLGKKTGDSIADLLVFSPNYNGDQAHLDIIVTEAKYVKSEGSSKHADKSKKQLQDTLKQISRALSVDTVPLDQDLWLSRISDMLLSRLTNLKGRDKYAPEKWRGLVRERKCTFSIQGYSHIFLSSEGRNSSSTGVQIEGQTDILASQEVFSLEKVIALIELMGEDSLEEAQLLREVIGSDVYLNVPKRTLEAPEIELLATETKAESDPKETLDEQIQVAPEKTASVDNTENPITPVSEKIVTAKIASDEAGSGEQKNIALRLLQGLNKKRDNE